MDLSTEQQNAVREWAAEGCSLSDIQKRLREEFGMTMTYMDVRFLVIDLDARIQDKPEKEDESSLSQGDADEKTAGTSEIPADDLPGSGVSVSVDKVVRPGALVSGQVSFSDGKSGTWALDQMGRLALDVGDPSYRPGDEDLQSFQEQLQEKLAGHGF